MMNREAWLTKAVDEMRSWLDHEGYKIDQVAVSIGWPSKGGLGAKTIGECWRSETVADKNPAVFISPRLADSTKILGTLLHELIHAAGVQGHGKAFRKAAEKLGLEGKMTATEISGELLLRLKALETKLGDFPHAAITPEENKTQSTRLLKVSCAPCDYVCRVTRKPLDLYGPPICPNCKTSMLEE